MLVCKPALHACLSPVSTNNAFIAWPNVLSNHYSEDESVFLSLKKCNLGVQVGTIASVPVLLLYSEHLHLPQGEESPLSGPVCPPILGFTCMGLTCQLRVRPAPGNLLSVSVSLAGRRLFLSEFCASEGTRGLCLDSAHLCIAAAPMSTLFTDPGGRLK